MVHRPISTLKVRISTFRKGTAQVTALYLLFLRDKHCIVFHVCTGQVCTGLAGISSSSVYEFIDEVKQMDLLFKTLGSKTLFF